MVLSQIHFYEVEDDDKTAEGEDSEILIIEDKCQLLCSQNCETKKFFAQNMPETIDLSPRHMSIDRR